MPGNSLLKYHCFIFIYEDSVVEYQPERFGQNGCFYFLAGPHHIRGSVGMIYRYDLLCDDRTFVQLVGDEMCGGADEFDTPFERLTVRIGADKGGEKGVMDVDDTSRECLYKGGRQDTHEFGEDNIVGLMPVEDIQEVLFKSFFFHFLMGDMRKGYLKSLADVFQYGIITYDMLNGGAQRLEMMADEDIG